MKIKICGITNFKDAQLISDCGVDYIGMIFVEKSPRFISKKSALEIANLKCKTKRVGVFQNASVGKVLNSIIECKLDVVQLHGNEDDCYITMLKSHNVEVWKTVWLNSELDVENAKKIKADRLLVDSNSNLLRGGSGKVCNWDLAEILSREREIILAGGISPNNSSDAVAKMRLHAIDLNSSVELSPRQKDIQKISKFIMSIKNK